MLNSAKYFQLFCTKILLFVISLFLILTVVSVLFLPLLGLYLFRCGLKIYVKQFKSIFGEMVQTQSVVFALDSMNRNERESTVVVPVFFTGSISYDHLQRSILNKIYQKNSTGTVKYPELRQCLSSYLGYMFWKWDSNFDLKNHVFHGYESNLEMNEESLNEAQAALLRKTFHNDRSPWEVHLIPKYVSGLNSEPVSLILIRFSHAITDGHSIVRVILGEIQNEKIEPRSVDPQQDNSTRQPINHRVDIWRNIWTTFKAVLMLPLDLPNLISTFDTNLFICHDRDSRLKPVIVRSCKLISIDLIKKLKTRHKCCFQGM